MRLRIYWIGYSGKRRGKKMKSKSKRYRTKHPMFRLPRERDYVKWFVLFTCMELVKDGRL